VLLDLGAGDDLPGAEHQILQQGKLAGGEIERDSAACGFPRG
jgi:hypothetical protein